MDPALAQIGKYRIERELGRGAMGVVYLAFDPVVERRVAIKTIRVDDSSAAGLADFLRREAKSVGRFEHPNIVTLHDAGDTGELFYIVMQLIDGQTLYEKMTQQRWFKLAEVVDIFQQVLAGLGYAHQRGVIHRDIKPANIMITSEGVVKLTDFGLAKFIGSGATASGSIVGTPSYMSPEQILGQTIDPRSDLFSVGCTLYEVITGEKAFPGQSATTVMYKILHENPSPPTSLFHGIDPALEKVVLKTLAKDPDARFQNSKDLATALAGCLTKSAMATAGNEEQTISLPVEPQPAVVSRSETGASAVAPPRKKLSGRSMAVIASALLVVILISVFLAVERAIPQRQSVALPAKKTVESPPERHPEAPVSRPKVPARADTPVEAQSRSAAPAQTKAKPVLPSPAPAVKSDVKRPAAGQPAASPQQVITEPEDFHSLVMRGDMSFQQNHYATALATYQKAYQMKPGDSSVRRKLAVVLTMLGRPEEAQKYR